MPKPTYNITRNIADKDLRKGTTTRTNYNLIFNNFLYHLTMEKFKITIKVRKHEPLTIDESDLIQLCWENIIEIQQINPQTADDYLSNEKLGQCVDDLMQNYFTLKMIYKEFNLETTHEMAQIEDRILNYQKRLFKIAELETLKNEFRPAFEL